MTYLSTTQDQQAARDAQDAFRTARRAAIEATKSHLAVELFNLQQEATNEYGVDPVLVTLTHLLQRVARANQSEVELVAAQELARDLHHNNVFILPDGTRNAINIRPGK